MNSCLVLSVKEYGKNQSQSIVFLHGGGVSGWMWDDQVQELSGEYHCLVPDLPEHGNSMDVKPFSIRESAEAVAVLIRNEARGGQAHVVGLSLGAQVVTQLLCTSPEVVDHAIINSALVRRMPLMNTFIKPTVKLTMPLVRSESFARLQAKALHIPETSFKTYYKETKSTSKESLTRILTENANFGLPRGLENANVPTLILVGQKEKRIMHKSAQDLLTAIPNAKGYMVKGVGHSFNFEEPGLFKQILRAWIKDESLPMEKLKSI